MADGGTYTLVVELPMDATLDVGGLGVLDFSSGWYAYTGSAFGPGGFSRVDRHRELANGERETRHWHVDYLLGHPEATVDRVVGTTGIDVECPVSKRSMATAFPGSARRTATVIPTWCIRRRARNRWRRSPKRTIAPVAPPYICKNAD